MSATTLPPRSRRSTPRQPQNLRRKNLEAFSEGSRRGAKVPPPETATAKSDTATVDAAISDAAMTDEGLDPALVAAAMAGIDDKTLPGDRPARKKLSPVTLGWAALGLLVALILGAL